MAKKPRQAIPNDMSLSAASMAYLGVSQQPFTNAILSADDIFTHATLTQLKDTIKHHLQFSELLLIIEGDYGSGKTTLFRQLMQDEIANVFLMPLQAEATDTLTQIQQKMSIHLKEQGDANYLDDNLKNLQVFDQTPVLMIDDAHVLSDTTLQEIIRYRQQLQTEKQLQIKILLFASKGMAATIEHISDIQHNQLFVQEMPALKGKQIQSFIGHKLTKSGAQQPPLIDDKLILAIYKKSAGNPLQVMQQAIGVLEKLSRKSKRSISPALPAKGVMLFLLLLVLAAAAIGYFYLLEQDSAEPAAQQPASLPPALPARIQAPPADVEAPITDTPLQTEELTKAEEQAIELAPAVPIAEIAAPASVIMAPETGAAEVETEFAPPLADSSPVAPPVEKPVPAAPAPAPIVAPAPAFEPPPAPSPAPAISKSPMAPALLTLADLGVKDQDWLLQQNPQHWTLQVLGARDPATLVKFVKQYGLRDDIAWYSTDLKGKPWYVLVYRFYTDKDIARQSIQRLPEGIKKASPWVKSVASVHTAITP